MKTRPRGIHANFETSCPTCRTVITITNGRIDPHECAQPVTLADLRAALERKSNV